MNDSANTFPLFRALTYPLRRLVHGFRHAASLALRVARALTRVSRTALTRLLRSSDYTRWRKPANLENWWESRTRMMAAYIPNGVRVIEFGAGSCRLSAYLDESCTYIPSDIVDRGPNTVICDLNHRPLPELNYLHADVALCAGVLEYVGDLDAVVAWLAKTVMRCVVSYDCVPSRLQLMGSLRERFRRLYYGYLSDFSEEQLRAVFHRHGFHNTNSDSWTTQRIFVFSTDSEIKTPCVVNNSDNGPTADVIS